MGSRQETPSNIRLRKLRPEAYVSRDASGRTKRAAIKKRLFIGRPRRPRKRERIGWNGEMEASSRDPRLIRSAPAPPPSSDIAFYTSAVAGVIFAGLLPPVTLASVGPTHASSTGRRTRPLSVPIRATATYIAKKYQT